MRHFPSREVDSTIKIVCAVESAHNRGQNCRFKRLSASWSVFMTKKLSWGVEGHAFLRSKKLPVFTCGFPPLLLSRLLYETWKEKSCVALNCTAVSIPSNGLSGCKIDPLERFRASSGACIHDFLLGRLEERKTILISRQAWIMVLLHFQVGLSPKMGITRVIRPPKTATSFQRWTPWMGADKLANIYLPQEQAPRFPHGWLKMAGSPRSPSMIGWRMGDRCTKNKC